MLTVDLTRAGVGAGTRTLDLGCGAGRHAFACLRSGAHVIALDASRGEVAQAAAMLAAMCESGEAGKGAAWSALTADAAQVPLPDASLDCVIAAEVLEHIDDDAAVLAELARVLRPGGVLALSVPRFGPELVNWTLSKRYHSVEGGHVRIYRRHQLRDRLEAAGLRVVGSHHAHGLHTPYWWLRCLVGVERADQRLVAAYHRLLVWQIERGPFVLRALDRLLDPLIGKSLVIYATPTAAPVPVVSRSLDASGDRLDASGDRLDASGDRLDASGDRLDASGDRLDASGDRLDHLPSLVSDAG